LLKIQLGPENQSSGVKQAAEKLGVAGEIGGKSPSVAKASIDSVGFMRGLKPPPPSGIFDLQL
jgi:hypothetical protein